MFKYYLIIKKNKYLSSVNVMHIKLKKNWSENINEAIKFYDFDEVKKIAKYLNADINEFTEKR